VGESAGGAVGVFPVNGFNTSFTTLARTVVTVGGVVALGVAGCTVTTAVVVTTVAFAVDTGDGVDAVVAVDDNAVLELVEGVVASTLSAATVPLEPVSSVAAGEEAGELADASAGVDDDRPDPGVLWRVVFPVVFLGLEAFWPLTPDADVASVVVDWWAPAAPDVVELLCAPPVLTTTPDAAAVVAPVDVEAGVDPDPVEVCVPVDELVEVVADAEAVDVPAVPVVPEVAVAPPVAEPLADEPDESVEAGSADATP